MFSGINSLNHSKSIAAPLANSGTSDRKGVSPIGVVAKANLDTCVNLVIDLSELA